MKKLIAVLCPIAVISLLTPFLLAQSPEEKARVIKLDVVLPPISPTFDSGFQGSAKGTHLPSRNGA